MTDMQTNKDDKRKLTNKKYYENKRKTKKSLIESDSESTTSYNTCLLYTSPSPRDRTRSRMPSSA